MASFVSRSDQRFIRFAAFFFGVFLSSCLPGASQPVTERAEAEEAILRVAETLSSKEIDSRQRSLAFAQYRSAVLRLLSILKSETVASPDKREFFDSRELLQIAPIERARVGVSGLHREGLGLPLTGKLGLLDPNAPPSGFIVAATALVLPDANKRMQLLLADPAKVETTKAFGSELPVAMNLEAWLDAAEATGPPFGAGIRYMLRSNRFERGSRLTFLQPFDADRIPVVLIHGLMSTPRMWKPVLDGLLADREIRSHYQFWFFYYPTGQPVPFSALQLREALTDVASRYRLPQPLVLIGHSMGGVVARAQVSRISAAQAEDVMPGVAALPVDSRVRNAVIFEPRTDIARLIFIATPHRGSRIALGALAALGMRLIDLPDWIASELEELPIGGERLPTSIHGLSPESQFLQALDRYRPKVPSHSIIGDRGRSNRAERSDGIVPFSSSHLDFAESELVIPTGHGGFSHPKAIAEIARILKLNLHGNQAQSSN